MRYGIRDMRFITATALWVLIVCSFSAVNCLQTPLHCTARLCKACLFQLYFDDSLLKEMGMIPDADGTDAPSAKVLLKKKRALISYHRELKVFATTGAVFLHDPGDRLSVSPGPQTRGPQLDRLSYCSYHFSVTPILIS